LMVTDTIFGVPAIAAMALHPARAMSDGRRTATLLDTAAPKTECLGSAIIAESGGACQTSGPPNRRRNPGREGGILRLAVHHSKNPRGRQER